MFFVGADLPGKGSDTDDDHAEDSGVGFPIGRL